MPVIIGLPPSGSLASEFFTGPHGRRGHLLGVQNVQNRLSWIFVIAAQMSTKSTPPLRGEYVWTGFFWAVSG